MKWILSIILFSAIALTGFMDPPKASNSLPPSKDVIEIFTEEGEYKVLSLDLLDLEKEFVLRGGILDPMRKIDLKSGVIVGYPLNLKNILAENKVHLISSKGALRATIAWHVLKNAGYHNISLPAGVKNGVDTIIPLSDELEKKVASVEMEDSNFEEIKNIISGESQEYQSIFEEKTPIFIDKKGFSYDRIARIGEGWAEQFDPRFIVNGEINKEAMVHRKILRERIEHEYYIPMIKNKNVVIAFSNDAYDGMLSRITEVAIKYDLSLNGVRLIPLIFDEIEKTPEQSANLERYVEFLQNSLNN